MNISFQYLIPIIILFTFISVVSLIPLMREIYIKIIPGAFNKFFKWLDNIINGRSAFENIGWFNSAGHSPALSILVGIVIMFTLFGPSLSPVLGWLIAENTSRTGIAWGVGTLLLFAGLLAALGYFSKHFPGNSLRWLHAVLILLAALYTLFIIPIDHSEASGLPYRHVIAAVSGVLVIVGFIVARVLRWICFRDFFISETDAVARRKLVWRLLGNTDAATLDEEISEEVNEFTRPGVGEGVTLTPSRVLNALLVVPFREPVLLLLFPALALLIPVFQQSSELKAFVTLIITWVILANGMSFSEWNMMINQFHRRFARGGSFAISLLVIVIGISHLLNVSYIRTVTDSNTLILALYVITGYVIVWLYDYWANRVLSAEILRLFRGRDDRDDWRVRFRREQDGHGWALQLHGRSRFMLYPDNGTDHPMSEALIAPDFMKALASEAQDQDHWSALVLAKEVTRLSNNHLIGLHAMFAFAVIITFSYFYNKPSEALVIVHHSNGIMDIVPDNHEEPKETDCKRPEDAGRLACRLSRAGKNGPVIMIAASGGGTRAALYTASVLNGMKRLEQLDQVVLTSGVSGGGVALAYLAANYPALLKDPPIESCDLRVPTEGGAWADFCRAMAAPFIQDVIKGAVEMRIVKGEPLGTLLAESFQRHFGGAGRNMTLGGAATGPALILNTTLAGHPRDAAETLHFQFCSDQDKRNESCKGPEKAYTVHAGGRLVFTNLQGPVRHFSSPSDSFPSAWSGQAPDAHLKYVVINDTSVSLPDAAALNANFPPVFSNAGVDIKVGNPKDGVHPGVYWVTDGGVADNRGVISLLYALRMAVDEMDYSDIEIPEIHLIVAEASGGGIDYTPSRGLGVILGSSAPFASQLMIELVSDIEDVIKTAKFKVHYLAMPRMFVSRGGVGTHWMMPESVKFVDPAHEDINSSEVADSVTLDKNEVVQLMFAIHDNQLCVGGHSKQYLNILGKEYANSQENDDAMGEKRPRTRDEWICKDSHQKGWQEILAAFPNNGGR